LARPSENVAGAEEHTSTVKFADVANSLVCVETPMGNKTPRMIMPTMVANLTTAIQYSISPNRRTFKTLNKTIKMKKTEIQT